MKKIFFLLTCSIVFAASLFAAKGICIEDNVRVRSEPSLTNSKIVGKLNKNDVFKIYDYEGTGNFNDGYLDYWVCISAERNKWVNAYWISSLPLSFAKTDDEGFSTNYVIKDYDDITKKFLVEGPNPYGSGSQVQEIERKNLEYSLNEARQSFLFNCIEYWPVIKSIFPLADPNENYDNINIGLGLKSYAGFLQYDQSVFLSSFEINEEQFSILYGIHVGMKQSALESILGFLEEDEDVGCYYQQKMYGSSNYLFFEIENEKIKRIKFKYDL